MINDNFKTDGDSNQNESTRKAIPACRKYLF